MSRSVPEVEASNGRQATLSEKDRQELVDATRRLAQDKVAPLALELANTHEYPHELFELVSNAGYFGLWIEPRWGGMGLDLWTLCRVIEELAAVSNTLASIVIAQIQGMLPILITASDEIKARYIPDLVAGRIRPAMALTEPDAGSDVAGIKTMARKVDSGYVLSGRKAFITGARLADLITVYAKREPGRSTTAIQGFLVPSGTPGLSFGKAEEKMASCALPTSEVLLEDCHVPAEFALGEPGIGFRSAMRVMERVRPLIAARAVGLARGGLEDATTYMTEREAFGAPLAALQGLQFKLADMAIGVEAARGLVERACRAIDSGDPSANSLCAMAKCFATDNAMAVTIQAVQIFGGYGVMKDYPVEHRMREAKISQIVDGTNEIQRIVVARGLLGRASRTSAS